MNLLTTEDCVGEEPLEELREANSRLKILVSELLVKNHQLRCQRLHEQRFMEPKEAHIQFSQKGRDR